jgi:hypothetical protein
MIRRNMLRKEQFAFGVGLVTAALAVILIKSLAWLILILGLGLVFDFYLRDLIWGPDRLTREEIEKMPAEEYKARVLGNPKTESWVNWLTLGSDVFKKQMRKLAREAVIFMLMTPLLAFAGGFGYLYHHAYKPSLFDMSKAVPVDSPAGWTPIPCKAGEQYVEQGRLVWECQGGIRTAPVISDGIDLTAGLVPKEVPAPEPISELLKQALLFGLYGFPAGLCLWVLYRAVLFAVKG